MKAVAEDIHRRLAALTLCYVCFVAVAHGNSGVDPTHNARAWTNSVTADQLQAAIDTYPIVLVYFYAPWCPWSQHLTPLWDEMAVNLVQGKPSESLDVIKMDCTVWPAACSKHQITGYPTIRVFREGSDFVLVDGKWAHEMYTGPRTYPSLLRFANRLALQTRQPAKAGRTAMAAAADADPWHLRGGSIGGADAANALTKTSLQDSAWLGAGKHDDTAAAATEQQSIRVYLNNLDRDLLVAQQLLSHVAAASAFLRRADPAASTGGAVAAADTRQLATALNPQLSKTTYSARDAASRLGGGASGASSGSSGSDGGNWDAAALAARSGGSSGGGSSSSSKRASKRDTRRSYRLGYDTGYWTGYNEGVAAGKAQANSRSTGAFAWAAGPAAGPAAFPTAKRSLGRAANRTASSATPQRNSRQARWLLHRGRSSCHGWSWMVFLAWCVPCIIVWACLVREWSTCRKQACAKCRSAGRSLCGRMCVLRGLLQVVMNPRACARAAPKEQPAAACGSTKKTTADVAKPLLSPLAPEEAAAGNIVKGEEAA